MLTGDFVNLIVPQAETYRNGERIQQIIESLNGQRISPEVTRQIIEPFVELVCQHLTEEGVKQGLKRRLDAWLPDAKTLIERNRHMHDASDTKTLNRDSADALLVSFVNYACIPLDLALYASDLRQAKTR